jgi:mRNA-degrading endonuclease YafQ of YafQ-DinJ toxin-antitoxin module
MPTIILSDPFRKFFDKLSDENKKKTVKAIRLLADNPKHRSLQVHQIKGTDFWEAYVNGDIRLVFKRNSDTYVLNISCFISVHCII